MYGREWTLQREKEREKRKRLSRAQPRAKSHARATILVFFSYPVIFRVKGGAGVPG